MMPLRDRRRIQRIERWHIVGDGLWYKMVWVPNTRPLTRDEILKTIRATSAVVTVFDALTDEFLGMIYANATRTEMEKISGWNYT
jgi:hypothetical protein